MELLYKFEIWKRLYFVFGLIIILSVVNLIYNLSGLNSSMESVTEMNESLRSIDNLIEADRDAYQSSIAICKSLHKNIYENPALLNDQLEDIKENLQQVEERYTTFAEIFHIEGKTEFERSNEEFWNNFNKLSVTTDSIILLIQERELEKATFIYYNSYQEYFKPMRAVMNKFTEMHLKESEASFISALSISDKMKLNSLVIFSAIVFIFFISGLILTRSIVSPLSKSVKITQKISSGDLTEKIIVLGKDETNSVLKALKIMVEKISEVINGIKISAENFLSSSQQLSSSAQQISDGVSEQAAASEVISSSIEQISVSINENSLNAKQTELTANKTLESIKLANESLVQTIQSMRKILNKISLIKEIAGKTNILAINAAIEAVHAGPAGKGFAVVANEVKKLADHTQNAAKEIDHLSNSSVNMAEQSGKLLADLLPEIENTALLIQKISKSSSEQSSAVDQINSSIQKFTHVMQLNSSLAEELAAGSEELTGQAHNLIDLISIFKLNKEDRMLNV